jgi:glycerol-3-phosphate O-acyltransferase
MRIRNTNNPEEMEQNMKRMKKLTEFGLIETSIIDQKQSVKLTPFGYEVSVFLNFARNYPTEIIKEIIRERDETLAKQKCEQVYSHAGENGEYDGFDEPLAEDHYYEGKLNAFRIVLDLLKNEEEDILEEQKAENEMKNANL